MKKNAYVPAPIKADSKFILEKNVLIIPNKIKLKVKLSGTK